METLFKNLHSESDCHFSEAIEEFIHTYGSTNKFDFLNENNHRSQIWKCLFSCLKNKNRQAVHEKCLIVLRILSRDKTDLDSLVTENDLNVILDYCGLLHKQDQYPSSTTICEAQKLLCNLLFNCSKIQDMIKETPSLEVTLDRISKYDESSKYDMKLFDVRILFLTTALSNSIRIKVANDLQGDFILIKLLEQIFQNSNNFTTIENEDGVLICEILKTLFNIFVHTTYEFTPQKKKLYENMMELLRELLTVNYAKQIDNIDSNVVNLLTEISSEYYSKLYCPAADIERSNLSLECANMTAIDNLIRFLNNRLDCQNNLVENLTPILTCFIRLCKTERLIRKHVRMQVLPPLKDVEERPEIGSTIRNKLCKLLTSIITNVKDLTAEFIFILCKENVGRMIKYTGYGNAAGMFANKGLLGPDNAKVNYSSESEDSETEEYEKYKDQINPIIGCCEKSKATSLKEMTDEEKELEALKLVDLLDQLQRGGLIQPCRIGDDGKPKPIEHILELEEGLLKQQLHKKHDSDSD